MPAVLLIGLWAAAQFVHGFGAIAPRAAVQRGGVAYFAHIRGFFSGIILMPLLARAGSPAR
ncbi:MAG: hypothetical protein JO018_08130 [Candidatus Eremiobacteraeota bacterium]|nr:hypothetical protein [Candidatus Eremiobacteraeota bacterium]